MSNEFVLRTLQSVLALTAAALVSGCVDLKSFGSGGVQGDIEKQHALDITPMPSASPEPSSSPTESANVPPTVWAGMDQTLTLPTNSIQLAATAADSDGAIASHLWSKVSGGQATLSGRNSDRLALSNLVAGEYVFRITVTDDRGATAMDDVKVTVKMAVPDPDPTPSGPMPPKSLAYSSANIVGTIGTAIANSTPSSQGGAVTSYSVSPSLPSGLSLNTQTGVISGTPSVAKAQTTYVVTARNSAGTTTANVVITVIEPPTETEPVARKNLIFEANFEGNIFQGTKYNANGSPSSVALDVGRQFCCNDSITKVSNGREGTSAVRMQVRKNDPSVSSGYRAELQPQVGDTGEKWYGFSVKFESPVKNGVFSGTNGHFVQWHPTNSSGSASLGLWAYGGGKLLIATNPKGGSDATFTEISTAPYTVDTWHDVVFHVNWSTGHVEVWWDGNKVFNKTVGAFTGQYMKFGINRWLANDDWAIHYDNLRIGNENATYADVAPNPKSATKPSESPSVQAPQSIAYPVGSEVFTVGSAITKLTPTVSGGAPTAYSVNPALPAGLSLNTSTGVISGTPTAASASKSYTVTASNSAGSAAFTLTITVKAPATTDPTTPGTPSTSPGELKAEGFGAQAVGGANSTTICRVKNLNSSGAGSLASCIGPNRTVLFDVSGTIRGRFEISNISYLTIDGAGQDITIDNNNNGDGISFMGSKTHHCVLKNLRVINAGNDGINVLDGAHDILISNVSSYNNRDGNIDIAGGSNVTVQYSIIGPHLTSGGGVGGMLITAQDVSVHHNLFAPSGQGEGERCPFVHANYSPVGNPNADIRNNLIWKFGRDNGKGSGFGSAVAYKATGNVVNNYYYTVGSTPGNAVMSTDYGNSSTGGKLYAKGNVSGNNGTDPNRASNANEYTIPSSAAITMQDACTAAKIVLEKAGPPVRSAVEKAIIDDITLPSCP